MQTAVYGPDERDHRATALEHRTRLIAIASEINDMAHHWYDTYRRTSQVERDRVSRRNAVTVLRMASAKLLDATTSMKDHDALVPTELPPLQAPFADSP